MVSKSSSKEVKAVSTRNGSVKTKCYFRITINEVMMERIVFQIEPKLAPIMCAKFIEMCTTENGYAKSKIFKVCQINWKIIKFYYYNLLISLVDF